MKKLSSAFAVLLIIAATLLVYGPALRNGFVWDDTALVLRDPLIRSWRLIPEGFRHFLFLDATASNFYRPIQRLSFVADYQFYGFTWPGGWHLTSILVHAASAVALFFFGEKLLAIATGECLSESRRRVWALGVALLWTIHPLHTSAVTYVAGRADLLAAMFGFSALTLGLISLEKQQRGWAWQLAATLGFGLALLSKESGVTFLLIWVLVLIWRRVPWKALLTWAGLVAIILGTYGTLRVTAHKTPPPTPPTTPLATRPILAARAVAEYASLTVAPITLRMERDISTKPQATYDATLRNARLREYQTLAGVLLVLAFAFWLRFSIRHAPTAAFCLIALILAYLPISNVFSLNATVAEHWLYVPSAFLYLAAALTILALGRPAETHSLPISRPLRVALVGVGGAWILFLGTRTFFRQGDWRDQRTFVATNIANSGDSARMLMNLANLESAEGRHAQAIALYREAIRRTPEHPLIWLGFAHILTRAHDLPGARQAIEKAQTTPFVQVDCQMLSATLDAAEKGIDPAPVLGSLVDAAPENWTLRRRYLEVLSEQGRLPEATRNLVSFLSDHPFRADSWKMLGGLLEKMGQAQPASAAYRRAWERDVHDVESRTKAERLAPGA